MSSFFPPAVFEIKATATDAIAKFKQVENELDKMGRSADVAGGKISNLDKAAKVGKAALLALGAAAAGVGYMSMKAGIETEKAYTTLAQAMANADVYSAQNRAAVEEVLSAYEKLGFENEVTAAAYAKLVTATGDVTQSNKLLALSADYARFKGIALADAAVVLSKAAEGNLKAFKELGITLDSTLPKNAAVAKAFDELRGKIGGQAVAYTKTFAGQMEILSAEVGNLSEGIGLFLIPKVLMLIEVLKKSWKWLGDHKEIMIGMAAAITAVLVPATVLYIRTLIAQAVAFAAANWQITLTIGLIAGLAAGVTWLWNKFKVFREGIIVLGMGVNAVFASIVQAIMWLSEMVWNGLVTPIRDALKVIAAFPNPFQNMAKGALETIGNVDKGFTIAQARIRQKYAEVNKDLMGLREKDIDIGLNIPEPKIPDWLQKIMGGAGITADITGGDKTKSKFDDAAILKFLTGIQNRIVDAQKKYQEAVAKANSNYMKAVFDAESDLSVERIAIQKEFTDTVTALTKKRNEDLLALEKSYGKRVADIQRDYAKRLADIVQQSIDRLRNAFRSAASVDLAQLFVPVGTAVKNVMQETNGAVSTSVDFWGKTVAGGAEGLLASLKSKLAAIRELSKNAAALASAGFSQTFIEQVVAGGTETGNALARSILDATPETREQLRSLFNEIETTSETGMDALAKSIYDKSGFATRELRALYTATQAELTGALAAEAAAYQESVAQVTAEFNEALGVAEATRDTALANAQAKFNAAVAAANATLKDALAEAAKDLNDTLTLIQRDFDQKLSTMKAKYAATKAAIKGTGEMITGARVQMAEITAVPFTSELNYAAFRQADAKAGTFVMNNNVSVKAETNATPEAIGRETVTQIQYGLPISGPRAMEMM